MGPPGRTPEGPPERGPPPEEPQKDDTPQKDQLGRTAAGRTWNEGLGYPAGRTSIGKWVVCLRKKAVLFVIILVIMIIIIMEYNKNYFIFKIWILYPFQKSFGGSNLESENLYFSGLLTLFYRIFSCSKALNYLGCGGAGGISICNNLKTMGRNCIRNRTKKPKFSAKFN